MSRSLLQSGLILAALLLAGCGSGQQSGDAAAKVNGQSIPMSAYNTRIHVLRYDTAAQGSGIDPCDGGKTFAPLCSKLKQEAIDTLVREQLIREYAHQHGISVSSADFNRQWSVIVKTRWHSDPAVVRDYAKSMGITVGDLKDFARQDLLQQEVTYRVTKNMPLYAPQVRLAQIAVATKRDLRTVRLLLKTHSFFQVAQFESSNARSLCVQSTHCGELGWIPNVFVSAPERAVLRARPGAIVGPIAGQSGYALLLVEGHDRHHPLSAQQALSMRRLLFGHWLDGEEKQASVQRFVAT